jgi:hypothetical protein
MVGRVFTILSIILGAGFGLVLTNAGQAFELLLMIGAGTGLIYILRWFWWRINALTEIVAMVSSLVVAGYLNFSGLEMEGWLKIVCGTLITTVVWVLTAYLSPPEAEDTLRNFVRKVNPGGPGWRQFSNDVSTEPWPVPKGILMMLLGSFSVYSILLGVGQLIYGHVYPGIFICSLSIMSSMALVKIWK